MIVEPIPLTYAGTYRGADGYTTSSPSSGRPGGVRGRGGDLQRSRTRCRAGQDRLSGDRLRDGDTLRGGVVEFIHVKHDLITRSEMLYEDPVGAAAALGVHHVSAEV